MVIKQNKDVLMITSMLGIIVFILTSTCLWLTEKDNPLNPEFYSIPATMYISVLMLTGQSIPDNVTPLGKVVVAVTAIISVAVFAIPAGIIGWGFEPVASEILKIKREKRKKKIDKEIENVVIYDPKDDEEIKIDVDEQKLDEEKISIEDLQQGKFKIDQNSIQFFQVCPHCNKPMY